METSTISEPNQLARSLTGRDYLSFSQISTYQACPLKWFFQYVEQRPHELVSAGLIFGGAIHAALEAHHERLMAGQSGASVDELLLAYDAEWKNRGTSLIQFGKEETADSLRQLAGRMLETFLQSDLAQPEGTILGIEEELRSLIIPGVPDLLSRLDLVIQTEEALIIRDFKTSRSIWSGGKVSESAPQLLIYGELAAPLAQELGNLPIRLEFMVITKAKSPQVARHTVETDPRLLSRTRVIIERVWESMLMGVVYPNPSTMNCSYCPFQQACRSWCG